MNVYTLVYTHTYTFRTKFHEENRCCSPFSLQAVVHSWATLPLPAIPVGPE